MKIGILTQPLLNNYGGLLQNYALQQVLIKMGHEVETIDHGSNCLHPLRRYIGVCIRWMYKYIFRNHKYDKIYVPTSSELNYIDKYTEQFINKHIIRTEKLITHSDFVRKLVRSHYEAIIVGSDQCWRPLYNKAHLYEMFLDFVPVTSGVIRISYAASFGTDIWEMTDRETLQCRSLVNLFNAVSVRENSAIDLCKEKFGIEPTLVLDPTLLLSKDDYIKIIEEADEPVSEGDLFYYILDPTVDKMSAINKIAKNECMQPYTTMPKYSSDHRTKDNIRHEIKDCQYPSPTRWLRSFNDAKIVIVDSFHGMVFSIIFNKPFWVIGNSDRGLSRFYSLLDLFGLSDRLTSCDKLPNINLRKSIDWNKVNVILSKHRYESIEFLKKNL